MLRQWLTVTLLAYSFSVYALVGDAEIGQGLTDTCVACHSSDGNSTVPIWPKIAGQHENYLALQIIEFRKGESGKRYDPSMYGIVKDLSDQDIADLAAFYASQKMTLGKAAKSEVELGQKIYRGGNVNTGVSACISCHSPSGAGNALSNFPRLSGQNAEYTVQQLQNYKTDKRQSDVNGIMRDIAKQMSEEEIVAVSSYVAGLR